MTSITVDGFDGRSWPPSNTRSMRLPKCWMTCSADVRGGWPLMLALVAVIGAASRATIALGTGWSGTLRPTVSSPPVVMSGTREDLSTTIVSLPGQKAAASCRATSGTRWPNLWKSSIPETNSGSGLDCPRCLTSKTRCTAASSRAAAAMPYRVSVGMATTPPPARAETASSIDTDGTGCCSWVRNLTEI